MDMYCSRTDTVKELISNICWTDEAERVGEKMMDEIASSCRLWKMEGDATFQDVSDALQSGHELPHEIAGTVLHPY